MLEIFHEIFQTFEIYPYNKFQGFEIFHEKFHYVRPALGFHAHGSLDVFVSFRPFIPKLILTKFRD